MRLLVLGGTAFLGRALVELALARGDDVTLFNRGQTAPELFPHARHLVGDRDGDLGALAGGRWDGVVDTSGYVPRVVGASVEAVAANVEHYVFVSSISVYASFADPIREESRVAELPDPGSEDAEEHYGALKVLCEKVVESGMDGRAANVRAGLIVGRYDPTGRLTYWIHRVARGGEVLVPAPLDQELQIVDVRDLAGWLLRLADARVAGTFNATAPGTTMRHVLEAARTASESDATFVEVDAAFLVERELTSWSHFPLWVGGAGAEYEHFFGVDVSRATAAGLTTRPLADTVHDVLLHASPAEGVGLSAEREAELLDAWRDRG